MMRTVEVLIVILIMTGAFLTATFFAVLPSPRQVSPLNLRRLALSTLETLDAQHDVSEAAFDTGNNTAWNQLQVALSASLPASVVYNLTVYDISSQTGQELYNPSRSISNAESLGIGSDVASYMVASSNVTFSVTAQKIGATLYILNCSDANGWWITGYTGQSIAEDLANLLAPYFQPSSIIMVQNTTQFGQILDKHPLGNESLQNAIVINTFGEAVPIPANYSNLFSGDSYAQYAYQLGERVNQYNWTWVSIVGYPLYYVSNTLQFTGPGDQNSWGIFGMKMVGQPGLNAFLEGLDGQPYSYNSAPLAHDVGFVTLSSTALDKRDYYGIYPSLIQAATRALDSSITTQYNLTIAALIFNPKSGDIPGAVYNHISKGSTDTTGSLFALGLTRVPDVRLTALGLLSDYNPRIYKSVYTAAGTSKLVVLQLGEAGGG
jgi:hypothetical protein